MSNERLERGVRELLRTRAVERLEAGQLPKGRPVSCFAGAAASNKLCSLCDSQIVPTDIEFELDFEVPPGRTTIRLHSRCYDIWDAERSNTQRAPGEGGHSGQLGSVSRFRGIGPRLA
jgi:hypothetical protein